MGIFSRSTPDLETIRTDLRDQSRRVRELIGEIETLSTEITARFREVEERIDRHERAVKGMAEELDERIDRGNKIWRKIRAAEYYERERRDSEEEYDPAVDLSAWDGGGGPEEGVQQLSPRVGWPGRPPSKAQEVGKALARKIAGLD